MITYLAAGYERLSKEDDKRDESSSIESQKMIIESFAKFNAIKIVAHYSDDGFTGSNFDRPGFERLKQAIENGEINCIIVKDLSRLGRQLYETGTYIEEYFLAKRVRFIAINDGYDSNVGDAMLGIRLSVNDLYLRDTSKKIRTTFDAKRKKGDYIATYPKYGYQKNPDNPKQLIIDKEAADVVRMIFKWISEGTGTSVVAHRLTAKKIAIPSIYKKETRGNQQISLNDGFGIWSSQTVRSIASDQMYLGNMVQGRWQKLSYNSKKLIELPPSKWIVVENTHEPIVSKELFACVQNELSKKQKYRSRHEKKYLFQGLLKCKECGHNISIYKRKNKTGYLLWGECNYYSKYSKYHLCSSHRINYSIFLKEMEALFKRIGNNFFKNYDVKPLLKKMELLVNQENESLIKESNTIKNEIIKNEHILAKLYQDRLDEIISKQQYISLAKKYQSQLDTLKKKQKKIQKQMMIKTPKNISSFELLISDYLQFNKLSNELLYRLIDRIEIDRNKNMEIFFKVKVKEYLD